MTRRIRTAMLAVLTALALFGRPVGTQVPVNPVPPLDLSTSIDIDVFRVTLEEFQPLWEGHFAGGGSIENLGMRCLFGSPSTRLYWGGFQAVGSPDPMFSDSSTILGSANSFVYLHETGGPPTLPPDQLFTSSSQRPAHPRTWNRVATSVEMLFLIHVLSGMTEDLVTSDVPALASWFQNSSNWKLENFTSRIAGGSVRLDLRFRELAPAIHSTQVFRVTAIPTPTGFDQVVVQ